MEDLRTRVTWFHKTKEGRIAPCRATKRACPLGGKTGYENHFLHADEAREVTTWQEMAKTMGPLPDSVSVRRVLLECFDEDREFDTYDAVRALCELEGNPTLEEDFSNDQWGWDDGFCDLVSDMRPRDGDNSRTLWSSSELRTYFPRVAEAWDRESAVLEVMGAEFLELPGYDTRAIEHGSEVYEHPQGKRIEVQPDGSLLVTKNGKKASSGATLADLRSGRGTWKRVTGAPAESKPEPRPAPIVPVAQPQGIPTAPAAPAASDESTELDSALSDAEEFKLMALSAPEELRDYYYEDVHDGYFDMRTAIDDLATLEMDQVTRRRFLASAERELAEVALNHFAARKYVIDEEWQKSFDRSVLEEHLPEALKRLEEQAEVGNVMRELLED